VAAEAVTWAIDLDGRGVRPRARPSLPRPRRPGRDFYASSESHELAALLAAVPDTGERDVVFREVLRVALRDAYRAGASREADLETAAHARDAMLTRLRGELAGADETARSQAARIRALEAELRDRRGR
jgi:hypothetical protein